MKKLLGVVLALPFSVMAAEPVAAVAAPAVGSSVAGQLTQLVLGLLLVLGLIFLLAWLLRRVQQAGPAGKGQVIELIGSRHAWSRCIDYRSNRCRCGMNCKEIIGFW